MALQSKREGFAVQGKNAGFQGIIPPLWHAGVALGEVPGPKTASVSSSGQWR